MSTGRVPRGVLWRQSKWGGLRKSGANARGYDSTMGTSSSEQEDYLIRIIKQAAEALRRLRGKLTASEVVIPDILQEASVATEELLGAQAGMLSRLDAETAVRLVGSSRRAELWADLVELEADALD